MISTNSLVLSFACQFIERLTDLKGKIATGYCNWLLLLVWPLRSEALAVTAPTITPGSGVYSTYQSTATITATTGGSDLSIPIDGTNPTNFVDTIYGAN
jgi:hypothetical protein